MREPNVKPLLKDPPKIHDYGLAKDNPDGVPLDSPLAIELYFMCRPGAREHFNTNTEASTHFWRACEMLWGPNTGSRVKIEWNPWAQRFVEKLFAHRYLGVSGCASSGKTRIAAAYALLRWLEWPLYTKVLVTSTSLRDSRKRIWGAIRELYLGSALRLPGKLVDSIGILRCNEGDSSDLSGLELVAGDPKKEKEAVGKLIGIKNRQVILIADEMPELSPALVEAGHNLNSNPFFQLVGLGNFNSLVDAFGLFTEPVNGWKSVSVEDEEWPMKNGGVCIRFDGTKSPNVLEGRDIYQGIYGIRQLADHLRMKPNSPQFWRMCRSFPSPEGEDICIYSEAELLNGGALDTTTRVIWEEPPTLLAFLDPAFTTGGDDCVLTIGRFGIESGSRLQVLEFVEQHDITIDVTSSRPPNFQRVDQARDICHTRHRINPMYFGLDATGAGIAFADIVANEYSPAILRVFFGGSASERVLSPTDPRPANEAYANRVTEIWYQGTDFVRARQIRGLPIEVVTELTQRRHTTIKGASGIRVRAERKDEMKMRLQRSPDHADSFLGLLELAIDRLGFKPNGYGDQEIQQKQHQSQSRLAELADAVYGDPEGEAD